MQHPQAAQDDARRGDFMVTFTGQRFWPMDPRPAEVFFRDVGHALSLVCRYGGHVRRFYSVAEHSLLLANHFMQKGDRSWARYALIHDAAEAYIGDMVRPLKHGGGMQAFHRAEARIEQAIFDRAGLEAPLPPEVKAADHAIIGDEMRMLFRPECIEAEGLRALGGLGVDPVGLEPHVAERLFSEMFGVLFPERMAAW